MNCSNAACSFGIFLSAAGKHTLTGLRSEEIALVQTALRIPLG